MKRIILSFICLLFIACNNMDAQCTPTLQSVGHATGQVVPDSANNLPHDTVGVVYNTDIQLWVPHDTTATLTVTWTDFTLTSVTGLPVGFSYTCNPTNCVFPANAASCIHLHGNAPTYNMIGTYPLKVYISAHGTYALGNITIPDSVTYYRIIIDGHNGIQTIGSPTHFEVFQNNPNPVNETSEINYYTPANAKITFKVMNMLGSVVQSKQIDAKSGMNQIAINSKEFAPGVYMYSISNGTQTVTKRMIIGNR